jgi:carbonic anhydrase
MFQRMYWILGRKSELALVNKLLLYKTTLKPIWTYGITLWDTACHSNIEILQIFQNKVHRTSVTAPRYTPNGLLHTNLQMSTVRGEILKFSTNYRAKLFTQPKELTSMLLVEPGTRILTFWLPNFFIF